MQQVSSPFVCTRQTTDVTTEIILVQTYLCLAHLNDPFFLQLYAEFDLSARILVGIEEVNIDSRMTGYEILVIFV